MTKPRLLLYGLLAAAILPICGCGVAPIERGDAVTLGPTEGIAAVVIDTLDDVTQLEVDGTDKGGVELKIPSAPKGVDMYVFAAPAGTYCLANFHYGRILIFMKDQKHGVCFDVIPGKIAYSGNIAPRAFGEGRIITAQNYQWGWFESALNKDYPKLTAAYPVVTP